MALGPPENPPKPLGQWRLTTLGSVELRSISGPNPPTTVMAPGKPLALIVYLAFAADHSASRDHLVDLLWSNLDPDHARVALRQTLWQIRGTLGDDALQSAGDRVRLTISLESDREAFLGAVTEGNFKRAVEAYSGPFLPDFAVPGGAQFEQWADLVRERLRVAYVRALEALARDALHNPPVSGIDRYARLLRDTDTSREASWRILIETLLHCGDRLSAAVEGASLEQLLAVEGREPEPATTKLLRALRDTPTTPQGDGRALVTDLVGREAEFAAVLRAWDEARAGKGQRFHVVALAGMGKTRLLQEVRSRLRGRGASVAYVRAAPGDRHLSSGYLAAVARALIGLPGAIGVSPAAASALVALDPALSGMFAVAPDSAGGADADRRRVLAIVDLLASVSREGPVALLLDDLHWADPQSRRSLPAVLATLDMARILVVCAERPGYDGKLEVEWSAEAHLQPLTLGQCGDLLASAGELPGAPWALELGAALHHASAGSPLLILESLRFSLAQGLVRLDGGRWVSDHPEALLNTMRNGSALERRLGDLDPESRRTLLFLALAGVSLGDEFVLKVGGGVLLQTLPELERLGHVLRSGEGWEPAHDEIAEAVQRISHTAHVREAHYLIGGALLEQADLDRRGFAQAARHFVEADATLPLTELYARWLGFARKGQIPGTDRDLARLLLGDLATDALIDQLLASRPTLRRLRLGEPWAAVTAAAVFTVIALGSGWVVARARPTRLAVLQAPVAFQTGLTPDPVIEVQDAAGRRIVDATDSVTVSIDPTRGQLLGTTTVLAESGRARFTDLQVDPQGPPVTLHFQSGRLEPALIGIPGIDSSLPRLDLVEAHINGTVLTGDHHAIQAGVGESIRGMLKLRYWSYWGAAAVMLGATPTWGDKRHAFVTLAPLVTPALNRGLEVPVSLPGPEHAGTYHLILFFQAEPDVQWIASGTNWTVGHAIWGDGNDIADWNESQLAAARSTGLVVTQVVRPQGRLTQFVPAAVIDIQVR